MRRNNTNSPIAAALTIIVHLAAFLWLGWRGFLMGFLCFLVGGLGTAYNAWKAQR